MAGILRSHCPRLKDLLLDRDGFNDEQVTHLINVGIQGALEKIAFSGYQYNITGRRVIEMSELGTKRALLDHTASLKVLRLHGCGLVLASKWIQQVLVQCSCLKELRVTGALVGAHPEADMTGHIPQTKMGRNRRVLTELDAMDIIHGGSWTCTGLRVLQLVIRNVPRSETRPSPGMAIGMDIKQREDWEEHLLWEELLVMTGDESRSVQRQICQQIGSLKWLGTGY